MSYTFYRMANKNKQYKIEKGLLLFTQPRSPYFYGKIRLKGKYLTKSFSPISDFNTAKEKLYEWKKELTLKSDNFSTTSPILGLFSCDLLPPQPNTVLMLLP